MTDRQDTDKRRKHMAYMNDKKAAPDFIWADNDGQWWRGGAVSRLPEYIRRDPAVLAELPEVKALVAATAQCCVCGRKHLSTLEDGGPECELSDGRWTCSRECWEAAADANAALDRMLQEARNKALREAWIIALRRRGLMDVPEQIRALIQETETPPE